MRGRKPKPTTFKVLSGNAGRRPLNPSEPKPETAIPEAPEHLCETARAEWRRLTKLLHKLGLLTEIDRSALAAYCQVYARWVEAEEKIDKSGLVIKTTNGNVIQSPLVGIANKALELMHKYMVEFGMTPSARSRLSVTPIEGKEDPSLEAL